MASASLANLPSSGLLADDRGAVSWVRRPCRPFIGDGGTPSDGEQQVLENDNATESLVRILRRQQHDGSNKARPAAPQRGSNKRPNADGDAPGGSGAHKRLLIAPSLVAGGGGRQPHAGGSGSAAGPSRPPVDTKRVYSQEELKAKTAKELSDLLKQRGLPVSGKKEQLMQRLVDFQRRQRKAALGA